MYSFAVFKNCQTLKNTNGYQKKVWDKNKTTWAVGIAQLTHRSVRGGGKNPSTSGLGIFCSHLEPRGEIIAQYRPLMSFRYISHFVSPNKHFELWREEISWNACSATC